MRNAQIVVTLKAAEAPPEKSFPDRDTAATQEALPSVGLTAVLPLACLTPPGAGGPPGVASPATAAARPPTEPMKELDGRDAEEPRRREDAMNLSRKSVLAAACLAMLPPLA